jgi:hypothetical protein
MKVCMVSMMRSILLNLPYRFVCMYSETSSLLENASQNALQREAWNSVGGKEDDGHMLSQAGSPDQSLPVLALLKLEVTEKHKCLSPTEKTARLSKVCQGQLPDVSEGEQ